MKRCSWCEGNALYEKYHDEEWGKPTRDDRVHFEFMILESAQAGLSWLTILKKREGYRNAYAGFDPLVVQAFTESDVDRLMQDAGIVRNRMKIKASIGNAKVFVELQKEFGSFSAYLWSFIDDTPLVNHWETLSQIPATTVLSERISKDLKKRGCKFFGPTIVYSHLQATGLINDHLVGCFRHGEVQLGE